MADDKKLEAMKQQCITVYQTLLNELTLVYNQTNLAYWKRRRDEVQKELDAFVK